jgi:hypothetical protein
MVDEPLDPSPMLISFSASAMRSQPVLFLLPPGVAAVRGGAALATETVTVGGAGLFTVRLLIIKVRRGAGTGAGGSMADMRGLREDG